MRKTAIAATTALIMMLATVATASPTQAHKARRGISVVDTVQIFDDGGKALDPAVDRGKSVLVRSKNRMTAYTYVTGLVPKGVYTYWWVVIPAGGEFPGDAYVAGRGGTVVSSNGKAFVRMSAKRGDKSIRDFLGDGTSAPFAKKLNTDLRTAEVHVEFAYHGQVGDAGDALDSWMSNFWTGTACPANGANPNNPGGLPVAEVNPGQPHCPVSFVAVHPGA